MSMWTGYALGRIAAAHEGAAARGARAAVGMMADRALADEIAALRSENETLRDYAARMEEYAAGLRAALEGRGA